MSLTRGNWKEDEDDILISLREYQCQPWAVVEANLPGRSEEACYRRCQKISERNTNDPFGYFTWSEEELFRLRSLDEKPKDWVVIAQGLPGHTPLACKWRHTQGFFNDKLRFQVSLSWTEAEEKLLIDLHSKGLDCKQISSELEGRSVGACEQRLHKIAKRDRHQAGASQSSAEHETKGKFDGSNLAADAESSIQPDEILSASSATAITSRADHSQQQMVLPIPTADRTARSLADFDMDAKKMLDWSTLKSL